MNMNRTGRRASLRLLCFALVALALTSGPAFAQAGGELRFCLRSEPKTFDPLLVDDDSSLSIRYLTGGVLARVNRHTQELEPELAESWKVSKDGKQITFNLRRGIAFTDFTSADVVRHPLVQKIISAYEKHTRSERIDAPDGDRRRER